MPVRQDTQRDGTVGECSQPPRGSGGAQDATGVAAADHARRAAESNSRAERIERRAAEHPLRQ